MKIEKYLLAALAVILLVIAFHVLLGTVGHLGKFLEKHR